MGGQQRTELIRQALNSHQVARHAVLDVACFKHDNPDPVPGHWPIPYLQTRIASVSEDGSGPCLHPIMSPALRRYTRSITSPSFSEFGVGIEQNGNGLAVRAAASKTPSGLIFEGGSKKLHHLSFGIYEADVDAFTTRLQQMSVVRLDPPAGPSGEGYGSAIRREIL